VVPLAKSALIIVKLVIVPLVHAQLVLILLVEIVLKTVNALMDILILEVLIALFAQLLVLLAVTPKPVLHAMLVNSEILLELSAHAKMDIMSSLMII